jgi:hypothetical protein
MFDGYVGANARVYVEHPHALLLGPVTADLLVDGVGDVVGRCHQVKGKEGLGNIIHRCVTIVLSVVLDNVGAAKVAGGTCIQVHPDNVAGLCRRVGMSLDDFLDDGFAHR